MRLSELWMHHRDLSVCAEPTFFWSTALMPADRKQQVQALFFLHQQLPLENQYLLCYRGKGKSQLNLVPKMDKHVEDKALGTFHPS